MGATNAFEAMMRRHTWPMILGALLVLGVGCGEAPAPSAPLANYFAASTGARLIGSSRLGSPERMIDGSEAESTGSSFGESGGVGSAVSVDVETAQTVTATSLRVRAAHDDASVDPQLLYRRAINGFRLDADRDGDGVYETLVLERMIPTNYAEVPGNASGVKATELDLTLTFAPVRARRWRFTATQGRDTGSMFDGPRLRETELYARP